MLQALTEYGYAPLSGPVSRAIAVAGQPYSYTMPLLVCLSGFCSVLVLSLFHYPYSIHFLPEPS